ncbi:MAG: universal stress protein [Desulfovibrionaceae bacterium]|nr:universal stress protein [Desulfovibrionaceae bacterium]MBO4793909.1 universal stress protein [Deltaproteobacteria bacterium]MBR5704954.1 universal stress protein [Deltaproteobacteria bacterium]MBR5734138.1 universal stress protein [Desulfovibrionaceae bacterium]
MAEIKKIICSVDLSDPLPSVAKYATLLAKSAGASVIVSYVVPSLSLFPGFQVVPGRVENFISKIQEGAKETMDAYIAEHFQGVDVRDEIAVGDVAEEILALADREKADVIVMGTRGRKGLNAVLFGSVAAKVVKKAECPVMTIHPSEQA